MSDFPPFTQLWMKHGLRIHPLLFKLMKIFKTTLFTFNFTDDPCLRSEERNSVHSTEVTALCRWDLRRIKEKTPTQESKWQHDKRILLHIMIPRMAPLSFSSGICFLSRFRHEKSHECFLSIHFVGAILEHCSDKLIIYLLWVLIGAPSYKNVQE